MPDELLEEMPEPRPFLEDGSQFGISATAFKEMGADEQRDLMREWFFQNFEDPQNDTPYDKEDGSYMYLWGGPFDAQEKLWDKFGDIIPETLINEIVQEVVSGGTVDWAPTSNSPFYEHPE